MRGAADELLVDARRASGATSSWHIASHATTAASHSIVPAAPAHETSGSRRRRPCPTAGQVLLAVQHQATLVDVAVEMDRELRDPQHRAIDPEQHARSRPPSRRTESRPDKPEVTVEPRVEQHPAVDLDAQLAKARRPPIGPGLDAQVRRIGVGAHQPKSPRSGHGARPPRFTARRSTPCAAARPEPSPAEPARLVEAGRHQAPAPRIRPRGTATARPR